MVIRILRNIISNFVSLNCCYLLPMSYSSTDTFLLRNSQMDGEVVSSKSIGCVCDLTIKKLLLFFFFFFLFYMKF